MEWLIFGILSIELTFAVLLTIYGQTKILSGQSVIKSQQRTLIDNQVELIKQQKEHNGILGGII